MRTRSNEIARVLAGCRAAIIGTGLTSGLLNILALTGSFFMLEVYDRVLPSRSMPTLVGLSVLAFVLFAFQALLDALRARILSRIGAELDESLSERVYALLMQASLRGARAGAGLTPLRDLDQLRGFLGGIGPSALFDLPWMPIYLGICFLFHPLIGTTALVGALLLVAITVLTEWSTQAPTQEATAQGARRMALAETNRRHVEVMSALGMQERVAARWAGVNRDYMAIQQRLMDASGGFGAVSKVLRMMLQSAALAIAAWLVIRGEATAGIMIASSILVSRALAPAELAVAHWRGFVATRQSWRRLTELMEHLPPTEEPMALPAPRRTLAVEAVTIVPPGSQSIAVHDASLALEAGQGLGIIGPSASGKSSLAKAIIGAWPVARGKVRLDGAALDQWPSASLGRHVGYLPQDSQLFAGTISENIARFEPEADPKAVIAAAEAAGVHDLILRLPTGYATVLGEDGGGLSAGQCQRIGLARALYGEPFLVVLDEPNSNLDQEGDAALTEAIRSVRKRGGICIVVAHRPSALAALDLVLVMAGGRVQAQGPRDEILKPRSQMGPAASVEIRSSTLRESA